MTRNVRHFASGVLAAIAFITVLAVQAAAPKANKDPGDLGPPQGAPIRAVAWLYG